MNGKRVAKIAVGTVLVLLVAGGATVSCSLRKFVHQRLDESRKGFAAHATTFLDDQRKVAASPPFPLAGREHDAGPFLGPRLRWYGKASLVDAWAKANAAVPTLVLAEPLVAKLSSYGAKWVEHADDPEIAALDAAWMNGLAAYDHWDTDAHGPAEDPTRYASYDKPRPSVWALLAWSKVRLLQGLNTGDARPAAREVRHVARLLHSTELREGAMLAIALLDLERAAFERQRALHGEPSVEGWSVVDAATTERLRRITATYAAFAEVHAPSDVAAAAFAAPGPAWARCAAVDEGLTQALMVRSYLESAMRARYDELAALLRATEGECRLTALRRAWAEHPHAYGAYTGSREDLCAEGAIGENPKTPLVCGPWLTVHVLPGGRAFVGHLLASLGETQFLAYEKP